MNTPLESRHEPIPGYRLIERLGRGGYGDVWKVEAPGGFLKAMKFVFGVVGQQSAAADQELSALRQLVQIRHPFILSVERCDIVDGQVLITMELADRSLEDRFKECRAQGQAGIPRDELLRYMVEAAEALDLLAHEYRLQHLDIKPTNLFLVRRHVKVGDFGLVRQLEDFEVPIRTGLTPLYAPPESYEGRVSLNSDQYSLALVYHEMLTGKRAIDGVSGRELMYRTLVEGPDLSAVREPERSVLAKALAKAPVARFSGCLEFVEALRDCMAAAATLHDVVLDDAVDRAQFDDVKPRPRAPLAPLETRAGEPPPTPDVPQPRAPRVPDRRPRCSGIAGLEAVPRPEAQPDGTLQPTLVIGLGGIGVRMGEAVRAALAEQFGEAGGKLPVQVLHLDVDPAALRDAGGRARAADRESPLVVCRLRKAAEYRGAWETAKHVSSWLAQEQIFRIGPTGETRGQRTLGRLALVDNYEWVVHQIAAALSHLLSAETAEEVLHATGLRYRRAEPCVYVAAGMGGGAGGGMAIDVAYLVRALLERAGCPRPNVCLALAAGIDPSKDRDQQLANQFALASDLAAFGAAECEYAFPVRLPELPTALGGPPAVKTLFFDAGADHLAHPRDRAVAESFAECVVQSATGGHDALRSDAAAPEDPYVGVGWFTLAHPHDRILRAAGCEFAARVLDRWLEPMSEEEKESRRRFAREFFEKNGYEPARVAERLQKEAAGRAGEPLHAQAAKRINRLIEALAVRDAKKIAPQLAFEARADLRLLLGRDPVDDDGAWDVPTPFERAYRAAAEVVAESLFQPVRRELESAVETLDRRFDIVRGAWAGFSDTLTGLIKRLVEAPKTKELEQEEYESAYQLHKLMVLGGHPRQFVAAVERWVKAKLDYHGRLQLISLYQLLKSKIDEFAVQVFTAPRKLEAAKQRLQALRDATLDAPPSLVRQSIFMGGAVAAPDALEHLRQSNGADELDRLEQTMRSDLFAPSGGIWQTCARADIPPEVLGENMAAVTAAWLLQQSRLQDAAEVFLERHRASPERMQRELQALHRWSAPSFTPKTAAGKGVNEATLVLLPASAAGQTLASAILELGGGRNHRFAAHPGTEVHFVQTVSSSSLGRLVPAWLLRGKSLYESAKYRGSAVIFPQTADV